MTRAIGKQGAIELFEAVRMAFPYLKMELMPDHPDVEVLMDIPAQPRLPFGVRLYLDGDELHMTAGQKFWLEWFPCGRPEVLEAYRAAVLGVLSGEYRIVEHHRGRRAVKAQLQHETEGGWETIGTTGCELLSLPWGKRTTKVLHAPKAVEQ